MRRDSLKVLSYSYSQMIQSIPPRWPTNAAFQLQHPINRQAGKSIQLDHQVNILMQNKNNFLRTIFNSPSTHHYRSIRYKSNISATISQNNSTSRAEKCLKTEPSDEMHQRRKLTSASVYKKLTVRRVLTVQNQEDVKGGDGKPSYSETCDTLMRQTQIAKKMEDKRIIQRVCLPSLVDYGPTLFTTLDPIALPIDHIKMGIAELKAQLPKPMIELGKIKTDLINLQVKITKDLQETEAKGLVQFERLWQLLRTDRVREQEKNMRFKRICASLAKQDQVFASNLQETKPRLQKLQDTIFACRPFQLSSNPELAEQFPQSYF